MSAAFFAGLRTLESLMTLRALERAAACPYWAGRCSMIVEEAQRFFDFFFDEPVFPFEDLLFFEPRFFEGILRF